MPYYVKLNDIDGEAKTGTDSDGFVFTTGDTQGDPSPMEEFSLNFEKIRTSSQRDGSKTSGATTEEVGVEEITLVHEAYGRDAGSADVMITSFQLGGSDDTLLIDGTDNGSADIYLF